MNSAAPQAPKRQRRSQGGKFSLKRQLLVWLLLPQLVLWLVGGALAFRVALTYAEKTIDQSLTQTVRSLARQVKPFGSGLLVDFPKAAQAIVEADPDDRVSYTVSAPPGSFLLGNARLPNPPPGTAVATNEPLFYDLVQGGKPMRLASIDLSFGDRRPPTHARASGQKSGGATAHCARTGARRVVPPAAAGRSAQFFRVAQAFGADWPHCSAWSGSWRTAMQPRFRPSR